MKEEDIKIELASIDVRGEIVDVYANKKRIRIVHTEPGHQRGGYVFSNTSKRTKILEGSVTFHLVKPGSPESERVRNLSAGDGIIIPCGTAYRENTRKGVWFAGFSFGDEKYENYEPYRKLVEKSFEK